MGWIPNFYMVQVAFAPLPRPFLEALRHIEIETSIDQASIFRLHFELSQTPLGDWDVLVFDIFRPQVPVRISVNAGLGLQTIINGYVQDAHLNTTNEAGGTTFVDSMVVPSTSRNQAGAERWMDHVYDRANYAQLIAFVQYVPVLDDMTDALAAVDPEVAANPLVNPPPEVLDKLEIWPALTDEQDQEYATIYADVTGG